MSQEDEELGEIIREFLVECYENLDQLDQDLVGLEGDPSNPDLLGSVFRTLHTIKGTAGFFDFFKLERLAHVGEDLLSAMRNGELLLDEEITSCLLRMVDAIRTLLANVEKDNVEGDLEFSELINDLESLQPNAANAAKVEAAKPNTPLENRDANAEHDNTLTDQPAAASDTGPESQEINTSGDEPEKKSPERPTTITPKVADNNLRVDVALLDRLMNMVGELVLARNQILQNTQDSENVSLIAASQRLNLITTELQEGVMKTRMQPIGNLWAKFPRVVRDVATECGKKVQIEMEGRDTELDKTIIEAIKDPLTHMVRNSVDHGIELPETRTASGKPEEGTLRMRAYHEGGYVIIEIADDGAGINLNRIKEKALENGLISAARSDRMSDRELLRLVFEPGLSTAKAVTSVSGRGVGMDVVRTKLEKIGGTVELQSEFGKGTTVCIKIPLTLAIIPALMVTSGSEKFAIPQVSLLELVRLEGSEALSSIEYISESALYRLRGRLLPLVSLNEGLKISESKELHSKTSCDPEEAVLNIVVLQAEGRQFGLVVDEINDTEEIVVKALGKQLKGIDAFAGATIMGDGKVALILDVLGIARMSNVIGEGTEHRDLVESDDGMIAEVAVSNSALLLVRSCEYQRLAIPLSSVDRLEEIDSGRLEPSSRGEVVQYRNQILPLLRVSQTAKPIDTKPDALQVVVYTFEGESIGLVVDDILDIVDDQVEMQTGTGRDGVLGTAIVQGEVTDVLDMKSWIHLIAPGFFKTKAA